MKLEQILDLPAIEAAPRLLGWVICRQLPEWVIKLKIVETEAYHQDDPASHSFRGLTKRTAPMFEAAGHIYVYFTYGMHHCINLVTGRAGRGEAVLLRAAEPLEGLAIIKANRRLDSVPKLANGPAKLAQALGIEDTRLSGKLLDKSSNGPSGIWLEPPTDRLAAGDVVVSPRIGISHAADAQMRFYIKGNPYVSKVIK